MKNLPLLLLGAGAVFLVAKKPAAKTGNSEAIPKNATLSAGSKEIGYAIYDCEKLVIFDSKKAYDHVFDLGSTLDQANKLDDLLFGVCFDSPEDILKFKQMINTKEKAIFVFNLFNSGQPEQAQAEVTLDSILIKDRIDDLDGTRIFEEYLKIKQINSQNYLAETNTDLINTVQIVGEINQ